MLENLINYVKGEDYLVGIYKNNIYIYNYEEIIDIDKNLIKIKLKDKKVNIKGNNLYIEKLEHNELSIKGEYKEVLFYE